MTEIVEQTLDRFRIRNFVSCLRFNGSNAYVSMGDVDTYNSPNNAFTITAWVKGGNSGGRIYSEGYTVNSTPNYDIIVDPTDSLKLQIWVRNDGGTVLKLNSTSNRILRRNEWTHLGWTDNNGTVSVYSMGELMTTTELNYTRGTISTMNMTRLGARSIGAPASFYGGQLDDFRIYKGTALTQDEIRSIMYHGNNPTSPSVWHKMDEESGTLLIDSSGNNVTGTITNATYSTDVAFSPRTAVSGRIPATGRISSV